LVLCLSSVKVLLAQHRHRALVDGLGHITLVQYWLRIAHGLAQHHLVFDILQVLTEALLLRQYRNQFLCPNISLYRFRRKLIHQNLLKNQKVQSWFVCNFFKVFQKLVLLTWDKKTSKWKENELIYQSLLQMNLYLFVWKNFDAFHKLVIDCGFTNDVPPLFTASDYLLDSVCVQLLKLFLLLHFREPACWPFKVLFAVVGGIKYIIYLDYLFEVDFDVFLIRWLSLTCWLLGFDIRRGVASVRLCSCFCIVDMKWVHCFEIILVNNAALSGELALEYAGSCILVLSAFAVVCAHSNKWVRWPIALLEWHEGWVTRHYDWLLEQRGSGFSEAAAVPYWGFMVCRGFDVWLRLLSLKGLGDCLILFFLGLIWFGWHLSLRDSLETFLILLQLVQLWIRQVNQMLSCWLLICAPVLEIGIID